MGKYNGNCLVHGALYASKLQDGRAKNAFVTLTKKMYFKSNEDFK